MNTGEAKEAEEARIVSVRIPSERNGFLLPVAEETVPAGFPSPAEGFDGELDLYSHLVRHPESTFFLRVRGDSMTGAGIFDDDLLVVDRETEPRSGDIVIAAVDGEFTVKRFRRHGTSVELLPENDRYSRIRLSEHPDMEIWGVVVGSVRKFR